MINNDNITSDVMYRRKDGQIVELESYIKRLETKDELHKNLSKGFILDDEQWKSINAWKKNHEKKHKRHIKVEYKKLQKGQCH